MFFQLFLTILVYNGLELPAIESQNSSSVGGIENGGGSPIQIITHAYRGNYDYHWAALPPPLRFFVVIVLYTIVSILAGILSQRSWDYNALYNIRFLILRMYSSLASCWRSVSLKSTPFSRDSDGTTDDERSAKLPSDGRDPQILWRRSQESEDLGQWRG